MFVNKNNSHFFGQSKFILALVMMSTLAFTSCLDNQSLRSKVGKTATNLTGNGTNGNTAIPDVTTDGSSDVMTQKVELTHLVDPFDGTYKKKVTIPKNFKGNLYIAGLNVTALQDKLVKVRINYGIDRQSITLNATVARAPGIIPKTDIQVLVVDMNAKPLSKMTLGYDLYDYTDYTDPATEPTVNPRDGNLYCRGLLLEDDPTFPGTSTNCSGAGDKCLYSYAKVTDATLFDSATGLTNIPTRPQVWTESSGVRTPSITTATTSMCLPDHEDHTSFNDLFGTAFAGLNYNDVVLGRRYRGPYRAINTAAWKIQGAAIFNSTYGLFEVNNSPLDPYTGFRSLLFPRAGKMSLNQGVNYFGSADRFGIRSSMTADSTGTSKYVDGCNLRVSYYNPVSSESIGSCNVNSSIEIFYEKDGKEINITTDKGIKLQVIRPSTTDYEGKEVLGSAFKRCDTSSQCGSSECCFNSRCWSKELVTQCVDQLPIIGNQGVGSACTTDFECSSLCCNSLTGTCAPHNPNGAAPAYCAKTTGQRCVAKEFCAPTTLCVYKKVKIPAEPGKPACMIRCYPTETYGACTSGVCLQPAQPTVPAFDETDPEVCVGAVDP
jgi:hypothetical protein